MKSTFTILFLLSSLACNQTNPADSKPKPVKKSTADTSTAGTVKKPASSTPTQSTGSTTTPVKDAVSGVTELLGNWGSDCTIEPVTANTQGSPVKSSKVSISFEAKSTGTLKINFFTDTKCTTALTQAKADALLKTIETLTKAKPEPDVVKSINDIVKGMVIPHTYKATAATAGGVGTLDLTSEGVTSYTSYKLVDGKLQVAETCLPEDIDPEASDKCTLNGETAAHRAKSFDKATVYSKLK